MNPDQQLAVDLYVRADAPITHRRDSVINQLKQLRRENAIREFHIHAWPRALSLALEKECDGDAVGSVVRSFQLWAEQSDGSIDLPFQSRRRHSTITDESDELLILPTMTVAAYLDGDLIGMAPCRASESNCTVEDFLDTIAAGTLPRPEVWHQRASAASDRERGDGPADSDPVRSSLPTQVSKRSGSGEPK